MDLSRSLGIFDPTKFKEPIHVIGAGATGSHVVKYLILKGIPGRQITVYDFDTVEEHNISNQYYLEDHIGMFKVEALRERIEKEYNQRIMIVNTKVENCGKMKGVIFLVIDGDRKPLFETMKYQPRIKVVIETGIDARAGRWIIFSPNYIPHVKYFEENYLSEDIEDAPAETSICGTRQVVVETVNIVAASAVFELNKWVNNPMYIGKDSYISIDPLFSLVKTI